MGQGGSHKRESIALAHFDEIIRTIAFAGTEPVLASIVPLLRDLLEADQAIAYRVEDKEGPKAIEFGHFVGLGPRSATLAVAADFFSRAQGRVGAYTLPPAPEERNAVVSVALGSEAFRNRYREAPVVRELFPALGLQGQDQIRVLLCDGPHLLAWLGAFRFDPFTVRDGEILAKLVEPLAARLKLEERLQRLTARSAALDVALDALGSPAFFLDRKGKIVHANQAGSALSAEEQAALLERGKQVLEGKRPADEALSLLRIEAAGIPPHSLLIQRQDPSGSGRLAAFAREWKLSPRQGQVLARILEGKSNKAIGSALGIQESTVELHVTSLLRKVGAESRSGLIATYWSMR